MRTPLLVAALSFLSSPALAQQPFTLEDLRQLVGVSSATISPDGSTIAVVTSRPDFAENRSVPQLVAVDVASGATRSLTFERAKVSAPAWSRDGRTLAFLAPDAAGLEQIWLLPIAGGEARCLTKSPTGVEHFSWRPDGGAIAFAAEDEKPKLEGEARHVGTFHVGDQDMYLKEPIQPLHIWIQPTDTGAAKRLTSGTWSLEFVLPPSSGASPLSWSKDGKRIAFARVPTTETGKLDLVNGAVIDVETGAIRSLNGIDHLQAAPTFAPQGDAVLYRWNRDGKPENFSDIYVATGPNEPGRNLTLAIDRNFFNAEWMAGGKEVLVAANDRAGVGLWIQPVDGSKGPARALDLDGLVVAGAYGYDLSVSETGAIAFVASRADKPAEVYVMTSGAAKPRCLTHFNDWSKSRRLAPMERVTWKSADGFDEDGIVTLPTDLSRPHPLVLVIHGGPVSASKTSFGALPQLMAAEGWVVFSPNYRGSDNLGNAYGLAILNDAGEGPGRDVMAGVAELRKRPYVDPKSTAVTGWSYGGYMTTWLLGKYPNEWQAGVAGAPVTNWADQYNLSDGNVQIRFSFGGSPWKSEFAEAYRAQSPITYATKIRAPTLVMANIEDFRVPPAQSFELFHALKDNGVETEFIAFQGRTHASADPANARERTKLWIEWVKTHLAETASTRGSR
jgi:dipeptidyl aminopeptidase/acylaminoacyl peptidase